MDPLSAILKSIPNPLIQCRGCRLLGNLACSYKKRVLEKHSSSTAYAVTLILGETTDNQTRTMALRACRFLLVEKQYLVDFLHNNGVTLILKVLVEIMKNTSEVRVEDKPETPTGLKINEHREKYFEEVARNLEGVRSDIFDIVVKEVKKHKDMFRICEEKDKLESVNEILKCMLIMTETPSKELVKQLYGDPIGLNCIVFFADESNNFRSSSLKILSNLSKNFAAFGILSSAGAVLSACELLTSTDLECKLSESESRHCINIICLLAGDACNRAKIRRSGTLKKLLAIAKNSKSTTEVSLILFALNNFQYDNLSLSLLIQDGLIGFLIRELHSYLNTDDEHKLKKVEEKKRILYKRKSGKDIDESKTKVQKLLNDFLGYESPDSSPNYSIPSPSSSRSMSPTNKRHLYAMSNDDEDNNSESYSPVCSDDDDDDDVNDNSPEDDTVVLAEEIASKEMISEDTTEDMAEKEGDDEQFATKVPDFVPNSALDVIENLLYRVTLLITKHSDLVKFETINTIIDAIKIFGSFSNTFANSLTNIFSESQFFALIVQQGIVHKVYSLSKIEIAQKQNVAENLMGTLGSVGESCYGQGELIRLLKSDDASQIQSAIAIAFLVKQPKVLYHLLADQGSLYILLNTILSKKAQFGEECADAITSLGKSLNLRIDGKSSNKIKYKNEFDESMDFPINFKNRESINEMKFIIHRGCSSTPIKFDKTILTQYNKVFSTMLNGNFREGNEGEIHLKDEYTCTGIKFFLNLIFALTENVTPKIAPIYHFDALLQSYDLSLMYIMEDMEKVVLDMIIYRLDETNCLQTLQWALRKFNPKLSEIAIHMFLSIDCDAKKKVQLYQEADFSEIGSTWNDMITDTVLSRCQHLISVNNYTSFKFK